MKITLANFKYYSSFSQETNAYEAVVIVDGVPVFTASNRGIGGADDYRPLEPRETNRVKLREVEEYAKTLPPRIDAHNLPMNLELLIDELVTEKIVAMDLAKALKTKALLVDNGKIYAYKKKGVPISKIVDWLKKNKPGLSILNELPFADALAIYRKS
jgi:hypothetical protein